MYESEEGFVSLNATFGTKALQAFGLGSLESFSDGSSESWFESFESESSSLLSSSSDGSGDFGAVAIQPVDKAKPRQVVAAYLPHVRIASEFISFFTATWYTQAIWEFQ